MQYKYKIPLKLNYKSWWVSLSTISYSHNTVECLINTATSSPVSSVHSPGSCSLEIFVSRMLIACREWKAYLDTRSPRQAPLQLHHRATNLISNTRVSSMLDNRLVASTAASPSRRSSGSGAGDGMVVAYRF